MTQNASESDPFALFESLHPQESTSIPECPYGKHIPIYISSPNRSITTSSVCQECGMTLENISDDIAMEDVWRFYATRGVQTQTESSQVTVATSTSERSIHADILHIPVSDRIKDIANSIYREVCGTRTHRGILRKSIIFACVFYAFKMERNPQSCEHLIAIFNIKKKQAQRGLKYLNERIPPRSPLRSIYITTEDLIQEYMSQLDATETQIQEVIALYQQIQHTSNKLNGCKLQSVAAGVIYYYSQRCHRALDLQTFCKRIHLSEMTILRVVKTCAEIRASHGNMT